MRSQLKAALPTTWPAILLASMVAAMWPVWRWYVLRMTDGSDEPCGWLALLTVAALAVRNKTALPCTEDKRFIIPAFFLAGYLAGFFVLPPLARALFAVAAVGATVLRGRGAAGMWGLLILSLPVVSTLQFYLGFPLRLLAAHSSGLALRVCGLAVTCEGSLLTWRGEAIVVDAPCSGIHMLWFGMYVALALSAFHRLRVLNTALAVLISLGIIILANIVRVTGLFFKEARIVILPDWTHAAIGAAIFASAVFSITGIVHRLEECKPCGA